MAEAIVNRPTLTLEEITQRYPIHILAWNNDYDTIKQKLGKEITKVN